MPVPFATWACRFLSEELVPSSPQSTGSRGARSPQGCWFPLWHGSPGSPRRSWFPVPPHRAQTAGVPLPPEVPLPRFPGAGAVPRGGPGRAGAELPHRARPSPPTRDEVIGEAAEIEARRRRRQRRCSPGRGSPRRARRAMTERCSLWSALSAAACCFYRGSFMQVQVSGGGGGTASAAPRSARSPRGAAGQPNAWGRRREQWEGKRTGDPRPRTRRSLLRPGSPAVPPLTRNWCGQRAGRAQRGGSERGVSRAAGRGAELGPSAARATQPKPSHPPDQRFDRQKSLCREPSPAADLMKGSI